MSEKATLLTSIPPVKKASSNPSSGDSGNSSTTSLLKPKDSGPQQSVLTSDVDKSTTTAQAETSSTSAVETLETVAVTEASSITAFQGVIYVSFVLTFCLAGMAAVVLFRKGLKSLDERFVQASKFLGIACAWAALSGFFATYLYANYLNGKSDAAPLSWLLFFWVGAGPLIGVALNHLLTPGKKAEASRIVVDAIVYVCIFGAAMIAVVDGLKENAVLLFSLLGCFLFIVPVARFFSQFKTAKARHPELREGVDQALIYSLLIIPGLFPILAFARVCGMSSELFIFLFNFLTFDFILLTATTMIMALPDTVEEADAESSAEAEAPVRSSAAQAEAPKPEPVKPAAAVSSLKPKKLTPAKPPVKPGAGDSNGALPSAPKKPARVSESDASAPNAPSRIKAPVKPKKRF